MTEFVHVRAERPPPEVDRGELFGGVETGGSWCVCGLGRHAGELIDVTRFPTTDPVQTIQRIVRFFTAAERPRPVAVGVGAFGPIELDERSPRWGEILATTPKRSWAGVALGSSLRNALEVPIVIDTDVGAAALGELRAGAGQGAENLGYVTVGTGIGLGLILGGRPLHGLLHPEAGHIRVPHDRGRDPFAGVCAFHGDCWEGLACGPALSERWGADPARLADDHPAWALEAEYVAAGVLAIVLIASPERVILGGGVMEHSTLLGRVREELRRLLGGYPGCAELTGGLEQFLVTPGLGDDAGVRGAIALAAEHAGTPGRATMT